MAHIVLLTCNQESPEFAIIVDESQIETRPLSDCYGFFGQKVGHYAAGDGLIIKSEAAAQYANMIECGFDPREDDEDVFLQTEEWQEYIKNEAAYSQGSAINAVDDSSVFDALIEKFGEKADDFELYQDTIKSITFHDGHNWTTRFIDAEIYGYNADRSYTTCDDDLQSEIISYYEEVSWKETSPGIRSGEAGGYIFYKSQWQGSFAIASVEKA